MANFQNKENSGALFKNVKKEPGSRQPDYRGDANVNGVDMEIACWIKETNGGKEFYSLSFKEKQEYVPSPRDNGPDSDDDNIPFP
jgi:hypothetical protein